MLETVAVGKQHLSLYESSAGIEAVSQLRELAEPLGGARVLHVNATPYGGGVVEILRSEIPSLRELGLVADWKLITGDQTFFSVTKAIHNGLQGAPRELTLAEQETYLTHSARNAQLLEEEYDLVVVHDPQPLALLNLHGNKGAARWVWRCHIDTSEPNLQVRDFLRPYLEGYDATVFTLGSFAPPDVPVERVEIIHGHVDVDRFHVRGFKEQGTTTTPYFDMVVLNGMRRSARQREDRTPTLISELETLISRATAYSREHLQDPPEIRDWVWTP